MPNLSVFHQTLLDKLSDNISAYEKLLPSSFVANYRAYQLAIGDAKLFAALQVIQGFSQLNFIQKPMISGQLKEWDKKYLSKTDKIISLAEQCAPSRPGQLNPTTEYVLESRTDAEFLDLCHLLHLDRQFKQYGFLEKSIQSILKTCMISQVKYAYDRRASISGDKLKLLNILKHRISSRSYLLHEKVLGPQRFSAFAVQCVEQILDLFTAEQLDRNPDLLHLLVSTARVDEHLIRVSDLFNIMRHANLLAGEERSNNGYVSSNAARILVWSDACKRDDIAGVCHLLERFIRIFNALLSMGLLTGKDAQGYFNQVLRMPTPQDEGYVQALCDSIRVFHSIDVFMGEHALANFITILSVRSSRDLNHIAQLCNRLTRTDLLKGEHAKVNFDDIVELVTQRLGCRGDYDDEERMEKIMESFDVLSSLCALNNRFSQYYFDQFIQSPVYIASLLAGVTIPGLLSGDLAAANFSKIVETSNTASGGPLAFHKIFPLVQRGLLVGDQAQEHFDTLIRLLDKAHSNRVMQYRSEFHLFNILSLFSRAGMMTPRSLNWLSYLAENESEDHPYLKGAESVVSGLHRQGELSYDKLSQLKDHAMILLDLKMSKWDGIPDVLFLGERWPLLMHIAQQRIDNKVIRTQLVTGIKLASCFNMTTENNINYNYEVSNNRGYESTDAAALALGFAAIDRHITDITLPFAILKNRSEAELILLGASLLHVRNIRVVDTRVVGGRECIIDAPEDHPSIVTFRTSAGFYYTKDCFDALLSAMPFADVAALGVSKLLGMDEDMTPAFVPYYRGATVGSFPFFSSVVAPVSAAIAPITQNMSQTARLID